MRGTGEAGGRMAGGKAESPGGRIFAPPGYGTKRKATEDLSRVVSSAAEISEVSGKVGRREKA